MRLSYPGHSEGSTPSPRSTCAGSPIGRGSQGITVRLLLQLQNPPDRRIERTRTTPAKARVRIPAAPPSRRCGLAEERGGFTLIRVLKRCRACYTGIEDL